MPPELAPQSAAVVGVLGEIDLLADLRQDLLQQEARVAVGGIVVLEAAVVARQRVGIRRRHDAGIDHDRDGDRHLLLRDQVVEDDRHAKAAVPILKAAAVLKDHDAGGLRRRRTASGHRPRHRARSRGTPCCFWP